MAKKIKVTSNNGDVSIDLPRDMAEGLETTEQDQAALLTVWVPETAPVEGWFSGSIVGVLDVPQPLPPPGEIWSRIDPRVEGNDKYYWLIITDKMPDSPATAPQLPDLQFISDLIQQWTYDLTVELQSNPTRTRAQYTTSNESVSQTGRYNFTPEFLDGACAAFAEAYGPGFTCTRQTSSTTNVIYNFFYNGVKVSPAETEADVIEWMLRYLGGTILQQNRYSINQSGMDALANATEPGVIEDVWETASPYILDGYGT